MWIADQWKDYENEKVGSLTVEYQRNTLQAL